MIVCSCNVFSEHQVRSVVATAAQRPRMSQVYACLGCSAQCGRCARTIKRIMDETSEPLQSRDRKRTQALLKYERPSGALLAPPGNLTSHNIAEVSEIPGLVRGAVLNRYGDVARLVGSGPSP